MTSCGNTGRNSGPVPEAQQVIGEGLKELYMAASAAAPHSPEQQKIIQEMAEKASSGRELLLVMRAAVGVFATGTPAEVQVRSVVAGKMMHAGTLDQLIDFATQYSIAPERAREYVERLFQLGEGNSDPRTWYRIRVAAQHLKIGDLGQKAQARGDELARR